MIVFFLMALVFLLLPDWRDRNVVLTLAIVGAVAASFSSLQGLMLWPVGLICLVWDRPRGRRRNVECGIWLVVCALTTASYFRGYTLPFTGPSRSPAFAAAPSRGNGAVLSCFAREMWCRPPAPNSVHTSCSG
jgi:hypothetical protein